ncbi:MAG: JAB domain-containing protein [bacterium]
MLNVYCWRCGTRIDKNDILGIGQFNNNVGKYKGKGIVAFSCPKCNKTRYQIMDKNNALVRNKVEDNVNKTPSDVFNINQVIDFYNILNQIDTVGNLLDKCETQSNIIKKDFRKPILQPLDVYNLYNELNNGNMRRLMILTLDQNNFLLSWEFLGEDAGRPISFEPKIIFHTPFLMEQKASVIIAQNLKREFKQPSQKDLIMTKRLIKAGKILGVEFLDHIVIEKDGYQSYDQLNYI